MTDFKDSVCPTCGTKNFPEWNDLGECINCARDRVLGKAPNPFDHTTPIAPTTEAPTSEEQVERGFDCGMSVHDYEFIRDHAHLPYPVELECRLCKRSIKVSYRKWSWILMEKLSVNNNGLGKQKDPLPTSPKGDFTTAIRELLKVQQQYALVTGQVNYPGLDNGEAAIQNLVLGLIGEDEDAEIVGYRGYTSRRLNRNELRAELRQKVRGE